MRKKTGKTVGVMMLETRFPRIAGDIGNPDSFAFQVLYEIVKGASPQRVVLEKAQELLPPFIEAGKQLKARGAEVLTTSCGFLVHFQEQLQAEFDIPVVTSALLAIPRLEALYGTGRVGILTISARSLDRGLLERVGIDPDIPIGTTEGGREFTRAILDNEPEFDVELCRKDNIDAALELVHRYPQLRAIVLECTNMPPYAADIETVTGLPVYSINTELERAALV